MKYPQVVIGRSPEQAATLVSKLQSLDTRLGIRCIPLIQVCSLDTALPRPEAYDTLLFTSRQAVHFFLEKGGVLTGKRLLAIGAATAEALPYPPDFVSRSGHAEGMAVELREHFPDLESWHLLYPTSTLSERVLEQRLSGLVASFSTLPLYATTAHPQIPAGITADYAIYYSPSGATAWAEQSSCRPTAISIGPSTSRRLRALGWTQVFEAKAPTEEAIYITLKNQLLSSCTYLSE